MKRLFLLTILLASVLAGFVIFLTPAKASAATYYISSSIGSDSNTPTQAQNKSTPWAHLPGMASCASNCASYTPVAGDTFVLKGNDVWGNSNFPVTWTWSGSAGNVITIGVDQTWYTGGAWGRPVFDAGDTAISGSYNQFWRMISQAYITIDNIEMRNFYFAGTPSWATCNYIDARATDYLTLDHLYLHKWTRPPDAIDFSCVIVLGDNTVSPYMQHSVFQNGIIENSDGNNDSMAAFYNWSNILNSVIHDIPNAAILNLALNKVVSGNHVYNITASYDGAHANAFETVGTGGSLYFHDNVIHDMVMGEALMIGNTGEIDYVWNNLFYNLNLAHPPDFPQTSGRTGMSVYAWNNTIVPGTGSSCFYANSYAGAFDVVTIQNNHCITTGVTFTKVAGTITTLTEDYNVLQTPTVAAGQGYTSSETYAYSPTASGNATVDAGTNLTSIATGSLASLVNDTSYACTVGAGNQVVCPVRTVVARPPTGAWDAGAYQFSSTPPPDTTPPTVSVSSPTSGSTVSGTITVSATASDNVGVVGVQFKLDGANLGSEDTASPYSISWDTTSVSNGSHTLTAVARDAAGNQTTSAAINVTVSNLADGNIYITQNTSGTDTGADCANAHSAAWFNTAANWGTGTGKISAGDTVHLCGTITFSAGATGLQVLGSGTDGNPITIKFETGAILQAPYFSSGVSGSTGGCQGSCGGIDITDQSYITVDGNNTGIIQNTANGSPTDYPNSHYSIGIHIYKSSTNPDHILIKNLTIQNIYNNTSHETNAQPGFGTADIYIESLSANIEICGNTLNNAHTGIDGGFAGSTVANGPTNCNDTQAASGVNIHGNNLSDHGWQMHIGGKNIANVYSNTLTGWSNWFYPTGTPYHLDGLIMNGMPGFQQTIYIYNNYIYGDMCGASPTAYLYGTWGTANDGSGSSYYAFNNLFVGSGGMLNACSIIMFNYAGGSNNPLGPYYFYNNTFVNSGYDFTFYGSAPPYVTSENNIFQGGSGNSTWFIAMQGGSNPWSGLSTIDHNDYYHGRVPNWNYGPGANPWYNTLANWQVANGGTCPSGGGLDCNSVYADPKLSGTYNLQSGSAAIGLGANLTSLCANKVVLCYDKNGNPRPSTGAWDIGAYAYQGGGGGGDTTPPTVNITFPTSGQTVSGTVTVSATASDNVGIVGVQFKLDGVNLGSEDTVSPYSVSWNTTLASNGSHTLTATARDAAGNQTTSASVSVTVNNIAPDTTPPSTPTALSATAIPSSQINLSWTVSTDNVAVTGYKIFRGGVQVGTATTNSYSDTGLTASTLYSYTISAYDAVGNTSAQSASLAVTTLVSSGGGTGGGGGGGGGGGAVTYQPPVTTPTTPPAVSVPSTPKAFVFTRNLTLGSQGYDVYILQKLLNSRGKKNVVASSGPGSPGNETTYFGNLTELALERLQIYYSISPASGFFGPLTRAMVQSLVNKSPGLYPAEAVSTQPALTSTQPTFSKLLYLGIKDDQVAALQQLLIKEGVYPEALVTGYFGTLTERAVQQFQIKYQIVSTGTPETTGYGVMGPKTRQVLNGVK